MKIVFDLRGEFSILFPFCFHGRTKKAKLKLNLEENSHTDLAHRNFCHSRLWIFTRFSSRCRPRMRCDLINVFFFFLFILLRFYDLSRKFSSLFLLHRLLIFFHLRHSPQCIRKVLLFLLPQLNPQVCLVCGVFCLVLSWPAASGARVNRILFTRFTLKVHFRF